MVPIDDLRSHTLSKIRNIRWRIHTETTASKFRTFIGVFSLFKSGCLSANIKLIIHKTLLRSTMTYVCPPGKLQQTHLRQGQHFQNEFLHTIRIFRGTGSQFACDFYSSDGFITKLARNKQKSYKITRINTFATCRMTSLNTESLNLAAVKLTTVN